MPGKEFQRLNMYRLTIGLLCCCFSLVSNAAITMVDKGSFRVYLDCQNKSLVRFEAGLKPILSGAKSTVGFMTDPDVTIKCQQSSFKDYKPYMKPDYDRAYMVAPEHIIQSDIQRAATSYMTNILPMESSLNRGPWRKTVDVTECARKKSDTWLIGGAIYNDASNDGIFYDSHNLFKTPDKFWKLIYLPKEDKLISWVFENKPVNKADHLNKYIVPPSTLLSMDIPIPWLGKRNPNAVDIEYFQKTLEQCKE